MAGDPRAVSLSEMAAERKVRPKMTSRQEPRGIVGSREWNTGLLKKRVYYEQAVIAALFSVHPDFIAALHAEVAADSRQQ